MSRALLALFALALSLAVSGCAELAVGTRTDGGSSEGKTSTKVAKADPTPKPTKPPLNVADVVGADGRLTVLILGSDYREGVIGSRTDAIIVAAASGMKGADNTP